uniref:Uncharacterized protein n=1 Tax=Bosea sp. NBC_00436 TaxID=2969620 RepID=A0A9E8CM50_9HYPH
MAVSSRCAAVTGSWQHQVEIKIDPRSAGERLRRIDSWCGDWQIGFRVIGSGGSSLRLAFDEARFAKALQSHFGGIIVPLDEVECSMAADVVAEDEYDRLARVYSEDE